MKSIVLLRGINVGGHKKVLMADLKILIEKLKYRNVQTYIQSGNVLCDTPHKIDGEDIAKVIKKKYGFVVPVTIRSQRDFLKVIAGNPFAADGVSIEHLYVAFLVSAPPKKAIADLAEKDYGKDQYMISGNHVYVRYNTKASKSKLTNNEIEKMLGVTATMRNWKTITALYKMIQL